jgi:hypothetical protein
MAGLSAEIEEDLAAFIRFVAGRQDDGEFQSLDRAIGDAGAA